MDCHQLDAGTAGSRFLLTLPSGACALPLQGCSRVTRTCQHHCPCRNPWQASAGIARALSGFGTSWNTRSAAPGFTSRQGPCSTFRSPPGIEEGGRAWQDLAQPVQTGRRSASQHGPWRACGTWMCIRDRGRSPGGLQQCPRQHIGTAGRQQRPWRALAMPMEVLPAARLEGHPTFQNVGGPWQSAPTQQKLLKHSTWRQRPQRARSRLLNNTGHSRMRQCSGIVLKPTGA